MPRNKPTTPSADEIAQMIDVKVGIKASEIAESVFKVKTDEMKKEIDGKISTLIYGGIIAAILLLVSIVASSWFFMADYQKHFFSTKDEFTAEINELRKEYSDAQVQMKVDMERIKDKQEYLEKLLFQKAIETQPLKQTVQ
jgi:hypothetical protein